MDIKPDRLQKFISELQKRSPKFKIVIKDQSLLMKFLGFLLFFNRKFMTNFATTIGNTCYIPKEILNSDYNKAIQVISHEYVHAKDYERLGWKYTFIYLFPITLLPLFIILSYCIHWSLIFLPFLPWPAPGRKWSEYRAYQMSLFVANWFGWEQGIDQTDYVDNRIDKVNSYFKNLTYYLMWPFGVKRELIEFQTLLLNKTLKIKEMDVIYYDVASALEYSAI
jgi:hypothetical protein